MLEARNKIRLMLPTPHSHLALKVFEKKRADCQFRTRNVSTEALGENQGAIKSLATVQSDYYENHANG